MLALEALTQALEESRIAGDRAAEASAWALHQLVSIDSVPGTDIEAIQRDVQRRAPEIERLNDARTLVSLRRLELSIAILRLADVDVAAERLLSAARAAGDRSNAFRATFFLAAWGVLGPMPVEEALAATQGRSKTLAEGPVEEAAVEHIEGLLRGMRGEFDEGLRLIRRCRGIFAEFGLKFITVGTARDEALIGRYAGDPASAERALRPACDELRAMGETSSLSTLGAELADALYELGRYDEAEEASRESERLTQQADVASQIFWRRVRAKLLARRAERDEALRLAREAFEWAGTDSLEHVGDINRDIAEVERLTGHADLAAEALERALTAYEQKGLVPMAERTRRELAELRASV